MFDRKDEEPIDLAKADSGLMRDIRGNEIGMIFQEPMTALNPVFTVEKQLTEGLIKHKGMSKAQARERALELMRQVRIPEPERRLQQYPHELSGGMRQRIVIAIALACEPRILIADEPTTALDVTIQAEILALIDRLKRETGTSVMFITHDMAVVAQIADRVVVMYRGNKVEEGPVEQIFAKPQHPYTQALLAAVPKLGEMQGKSLPEPMKLMSAPEGTPDPKPIVGTDKVLLKVENLVTRFPVKGGLLRRTIANVHAVEDVSLDAQRRPDAEPRRGIGLRQVHGGAVDPAAGGAAVGQDRARRHGHHGAADPSELRKARQHMQMIFQDPFASLNPQMLLSHQVAEPMQNFGGLSASERNDRVAMLFDRVQLPRDFMGRYPARIVRRPAAARRHRPGAGAEPQAHHRR
jgi:ABC-type glutathione transport system ATPase component